MPSLKEVKNRIQTVTSTQQITKAMKMVAAAKLRRAQDSIIQMRPYAEKLSHILVNVSAGVEDEDNEFGIVRPEEKVLIVAISSDRGLCGAFNSNVIKAVNAVIREKYNDQKVAGNISILPIGKKVSDHFIKREFEVVNDFAETFSKLSYNAVKEAAEYVMDAFVAGTYDKVEVVYNEFKNVATQILRTEQFLPIAQATNDENTIESNVDYIYEPSKDEIIKEIIPNSLKIQLYKAVLESNASEHGARMTAMDKATENAGDLLKDLKLTYNRTRQAAITKEILEIVAGAEALGG
ncbi:MAG: ATP synthase F1 subunit gamma [Bacteroidota bacterium]